MGGLLFLGFILLSSLAVWESTEKRLGTTDELRTLAAVFAAIFIGTGVSALLV